MRLNRPMGLLERAGWIAMCLAMLVVDVAEAIDVTIEELRR